MSRTFIIENVIVFAFWFQMLVPVKNESMRGAYTQGNYNRFEKTFRNGFDFFNV